MKITFLVICMCIAIGGGAAAADCSCSTCGADPVFIQPDSRSVRMVFLLREARKKGWKVIKAEDVTVVVRKGSRSKTVKDDCGGCGKSEKTVKKSTPGQG